MSVTPYQGTTVQIVTNNTAVQAIPAGAAGGYIVNPFYPTDQGLSSVEPLYVDPVGGCGGSSLPQANGTVVLLMPGETWNFIPGSTSPANVNAASAGHKFTVVYWM